MHLRLVEVRSRAVKEGFGEVEVQSLVPLVGLEVRRLPLVRLGVSVAAGESKSARCSGGVVAAAVVAPKRLETEVADARAVWKTSTTNAIWSAHSTCDSWRLKH